MKEIPIFFLTTFLPIFFLVNFIEGEQKPKNISNKNEINN